MCTTFHFLQFNERISIGVLGLRGKSYISGRFFNNKSPCTHSMRLLLSQTNAGSPTSKGFEGCTHTNAHMYVCRRPIGGPADSTTTSAQLPGLVGWLKQIYCFKCNLHKNQTISSAENVGKRKVFTFAGGNVFEPHPKITSQYTHSINNFNLNI